MKGATRLVALAFSLVTSAMAIADDQVAPPKNLAEALERLDRELPQSTKDQFKSLPESDAGTRVHFGLGARLRGEWGLWSGSELKTYFVNIGVRHPDHMSAIILNSYWRRLNGKPLDVEKQADCYTRWEGESVRLRKEAESRGEDSWGIPTFHCPDGLPYKGGGRITKINPEQ